MHKILRFNAYFFNQSLVSLDNEHVIIVRLSKARPLIEQDGLEPQKSPLIKDTHRVHNLLLLFTMLL